MVDRTGVRAGSVAGLPPVSSAGLSGWLAVLADAAGSVACSDAEAIEQIGVLERLKAACAARQAELTAGFAASQRAAQRAAGEPAARVGRGLGLQVGPARQDSPHKGSRHVGLAEALVADMPHTLAALYRGDTSEWRATLMVRETACLSREHRRQVDATLGPQLAGLGDAQVAGRARRCAYLLDPAAEITRRAKATADRRVGVRPAPDTMGYLSALLPVAQAVACYAALSKHADRCVAAGDARSRGQIMADELVARLTGAATAEATDAEIVLIVSTNTLFAPPTTSDHTATDEPSADTDSGSSTADSSTADTDGAGAADSGNHDGGETGRAGAADTGGGRADNHGDTEHGRERSGPADTDHADTPDPEPRPTPGPPGTDPPFDPADEPGILPGYGPVPAALVRTLARNPDARIWIRRLFTDPTGTRLLAADTRRRLFPAHLRRALIVRDQTCRMPYCNAPIRHADHVHPHADGGPTSLDNGAGLCQDCNLNKDALNLTTHTDPNATLTLTTPTSHTYTTHPPPLPGTHAA